MGIERHPVGERREWRKDKSSAPVMVTIMETNQRWETGGTKRPFADNGYIVRTDDGLEMTATPMQVHMPAIGRPKFPYTAHTVAEVSALFPPLDLTTLLAYSLGPGNEFAPGDTSEVDGRAVSAANPSESWMVALLTRLEIPFAYEPTSFTLDSAWGPMGFTPDLYLPELDLHVELTVAQEYTVKQKRWRIYATREQHPGVRITIMQAEDFVRLAAGELTRDTVLGYFANGTRIDCGEKAAMYSHGEDPNVHPKRRERKRTTDELLTRMFAQTPAVVWQEALVTA